MLYSVVLGNQKTISNDWAITEDTFGNSFIENEAIHQRVKFGKNVKIGLETEYSAAYVKCYKLPERTMCRNNNKTMALTLLNYWSKDKEEMKTYQSDQLLFVTLNNENYKLLDYYTSCEDVSESYCSIIQTYRKKDAYQGCALRFRDASDLYFEIWAKDLKQNRFVIITITVDQNGMLRVKKTSDIDKEVCGKFKKLTKKYENRNNHFKVEFNHDGVDQFISKAFIVSKKYYDETLEKLSGVKGTRIIIMETRHFDNNLSKTEKEKIHDALEKVLVDEGIRVVTIKGLKVSPTFCKDYKIMYLFSFDEETDEFSCIKSN